MNTTATETPHTFPMEDGDGQAFLRKDDANKHTSLCSSGPEKSLTDFIFWSNRSSWAVSGDCVQDAGAGLAVAQTIRPLKVLGVFEVVTPVTRPIKVTSGHHGPKLGA